VPVPRLKPESLILVHLTATELSGAVVQEGAVPATVSVQVEVASKARLKFQVAVAVDEAVELGAVALNDKVLGLSARVETVNQGAILSLPNGSLSRAGTANSRPAVITVGKRTPI
jgi:hypothetical protein